MRRTITIHMLAALRAEIMSTKLGTLGMNRKPLNTDQMAGVALLALDYVMGMEGIAQNEDFMQFVRASIALVTDKRGTDNEAIQKLIEQARNELKMAQAIASAHVPPVPPAVEETTPEGAPETVESIPEASI